MIYTALLIFMFNLSIMENVFAEQALAVKTQQIITTVPTYEILAYARLDEDRQALYFKREGLIEKMFVNEGEQIKEGQKLALLDTSQLENEKKQIQTLLKYSKLKLDQAKTLSQSEFISPDILNDRLKDFEINQLKLNNLGSEIKKRTLYSPINGTIISKEIKFPRPVSIGEPVFIVKDNRHPWILTAQLTQAEALQVKRNDSVNVFFHSMPHNKLSGTVDYIEKFIHRNDNMIEVKIHLNKTKTPLYTGMVAKVMIQISTTTQQTNYQLPLQAVFNVMHNNADIYVVDKEHKAKKINIQYGVISNGLVMVMTDLSAYELVISEGIHRLKEGMPVSIIK